MERDNIIKQLLVDYISYHNLTGMEVIECWLECNKECYGDNLEIVNKVIDKVKNRG